MESATDPSFSKTHAHLTTYIAGSRTWFLISATHLARPRRTSLKYATGLQLSIACSLKKEAYNKDTPHPALQAVTPITLNDN